MIISISAGFLLLTIAAGYAFYKWHKAVELMQTLAPGHTNELLAANELLELKLKMKSLQAQVSQHFLYNSFNHIQYYINRQDRHAALSYVARFSRFMRLMMRQADEETVTLGGDINLIQQYLELEHTRFAERFTFEYHIPFDLPVHELRTPPLLLYRCVEYALYHKIINNNSQGHIMVTFEYSAKGLSCLIACNISGGEYEQTSRTNGERDYSLPGDEAITERISVINKETPGSILIRDEALKHETGQTHGHRLTVSFPFVKALTTAPGDTALVC
jgi:LytS/YehU family sensor histidine kinase